MADSSSRNLFAAFGHRLIEAVWKLGFVCRFFAAILRAQLAAWDKVTAKKAEENAMFKKVMDSMRTFAQRSGRWKNDTDVDFKMAWNHYFAQRKS